MFKTLPGTFFGKLLIYIPFSSVMFIISKVSQIKCKLEKIDLLTTLQVWSEWTIEGIFVLPNCFAYFGFAKSTNIDGENSKWGICEGS